MNKWNSTAEQIIPHLHKICTEDFSAGIGGSIAKGAADDHADLDLYIFSSNWKLLGECREIFSDLDSCRDISSWEADDRSEGGIDFNLNGIDVECWFRNSDKIDRQLKKLLNGEAETEIVFWTPAGFHNYTLLSDLKYIIPLIDEHALISHWQKALCVYPEKLRKNIISVNREALFFWRDNIHLKSALKRDDALYLRSILQQGIHSLVQILFAQNRIYFSGDKQLLSKIGKLQNKPEETVFTLKALIEEKVDSTSFDRLYSLSEKICR